MDIMQKRQLRIPVTLSQHTDDIFGLTQQRKPRQAPEHVRLRELPLYFILHCTLEN